jgi:hypothetical protein
MTLGDKLIPPDLELTVEEAEALSKIEDDILEEARAEYFAEAEKLAPFDSSLSREAILEQVREIARVIFARADDRFVAAFWKMREEQRTLN